MGQKTNPIGFRVGVNRSWDSRWYAGSKEYGKLLHEDLALRKHLYATLKGASISRILVERAAKNPSVTIFSARPGVIIGKRGADIEKLREDLKKTTGMDISLNIQEIRKPELDAKLVAETVAQQLERRIAFRRAMKRAVQNSLRMGALGIRINCAGKAGGSGDCAYGVVSRGTRSVAYIACRHRLRHGERDDHLRRLRCQGLDFQGRDHELRSDRTREAARQRESRVREGEIRRVDSQETETSQGA